LTDDVVKKAENIYKGRQTNLAKIMEKLNDEMLYLEQQKKKLYEEIDASKIAKQGFLDAKSKLMMEQDRILVQTRAKEEEKWNLLKLEARKLIEELQSKDKLSKPELAAYKHQLNQSGDDEKISFYDDELSVGDEVYIIPYQQNGIIKAIKNNEYRVLFGHFDLYFRPSDLRKEEKKMDTKKVIKSVKTIGQTPERIASFEVDLRGFRFDEVKDELDQAIDRALLSGLHSLRIIHGFGSGAVRKAVYDYIKSSPYIKTSRFGGEGEGLNGVTIITLK
ncbi:MAG: Smr/MutS family protein, partial [Acholeplasmataceae bacterium]|nr:Smr/MutS family protein [Acholeplasmataceae bacterium]